MAAWVAFVVGLVGLAGCSSETMTWSVRDRNTAMQLYQQGASEKALASFESATRQNSRDYVSFFFQGKLHDDAGRLTLAANSYRQSLEAQLLTPEGREDLKQRDQTVEAYSKLIARLPGRDVELAGLRTVAEQRQTLNDWYLLARAYTAIGDPDAAIDAYNRAMLISRDDASVSRDAGLFLLDVAQNERAKPVLVRAYQLTEGEDERVIAGLRKIGVVPGPSLFEEDQLAQPVLPKGPLPEVEISIRDSTPARSTPAE